MTAPAVVRRRTSPVHPVVVHRYPSLIELRAQLVSLERSGAPDLVAMLILDEWFAGRLTSLAKRTRAARALVIAAAPGRARTIAIPGCADGDNVPGWHTTQFEPELDRALAAARLLTRPGQPVVVLAPAGVDIETNAAVRRAG